MVPTRLSPCRIQLIPMPQLAEAKGADDDWTGLADAASRRKRQIRLGTRAYRRRKALRSAYSAPEMSLSTTETSGMPCWDEEEQKVCYLPTSSAMTLNKFGRGPLFDGSSPATRRVLFPLSSDHLITLIQINVLRACHTNSHLLSGTASHGPHDCTNGTLRVIPAVQNVKEVPSTLAPSRLQSMIPHEAWVDVFPHPGWRDNFLRALGSFDEDELCSDLVGGLFEGGTAVECERRGMVVWSPPWHYDGWELSEGFLLKWGWSIKGCEEILQATNRWRTLRGEKPLVMEI